MSFHVGQQVVCVNDKFSSDQRWRQTVRTFPSLETRSTRSGKFTSRAADRFLLPPDRQSTHAGSPPARRAGIQQPEFPAGQDDQYRGVREDCWCRPMTRRGRRMIWSTPSRAACVGMFAQILSGIDRDAGIWPALASGEPIPAPSQTHRTPVMPFACSRTLRAPCRGRRSDRSGGTRSCGQTAHGPTRRRSRRHASFRRSWRISICRCRAPRGRWLHGSRSRSSRSARRRPMAKARARRTWTYPSRLRLELAYRFPAP